jgi:hypothetical protein
MSEQATEAAPDAQVTEATEPEAPELGDAGQKAIKAEREARKAAEKSAAELAARLKEIEDANLSDLERARQEAETNAAELAKLREDNIRQRVALDKGIPADLIEFLGSGSEEEITSRADVLVARLNTPTTPKPDLSQGAKGDTIKPSTAQQFADQLGDF